MSEAEKPGKRAATYSAGGRNARSCTLFLVQLGYWVVGTCGNVLSMPHPTVLGDLASGTSMRTTIMYLSNHVVAVVNFSGHRATNASNCKSEIENRVVSVFLIDSLVIIFE